MQTPICKRLGCELPIFAFSHCRDVVVEVSKAGGFGVLGAATFSPESVGGMRRRFSASLPSVHGIEHHQSGVVHPAIGIHKALREPLLQGHAQRVPAQFDAA